MINKYIAFATIAVLIVFLSYIIKFHIQMGYGLSGDTAVWGQLGDYAGGLLNPVLSFISLVLLIKSLRLQNEANKSLSEQLVNSEKTEKIKSFEVIFFGLLSQQKEIFSAFIVDDMSGAEAGKKIGPAAVLEIEDKIEEIRASGSDEDIQGYLESIDESDGLYRVGRAFYVIVRMVSDRLSDAEGFTAEDRRGHLRALINFMDFANLRLILIWVQFQDYFPAEYIRENEELRDELQAAGIKFNLY